MSQSWDGRFKGLPLDGWPSITGPKGRLVCSRLEFEEVRLRVSNFDRLTFNFDDHTGPGQMVVERLGDRGHLLRTGNAR
jgi:hypothetical protein